MNQSPHRFLPRPAQRLVLAALLSLPLAGACSSSSDAPSTPITFDVEIATLDGKAPTDDVALRCDHQQGKAESTLAVTVTITSTPANNFVLRPANACGASTRCGYVRIQALSADDQVLSTVDTATTSGVLVIAAARLADVAQVQVSLIRGLDQEPLLNPDGSAVTAVASPTFVAPSECADEVTAAGGAGGAGNGGAGGESPLGGAGGVAPTPGNGGAGGEAGSPVGGNGGADTTPVGGAAGASPVAGAGMGGA